MANLYTIRVPIAGFIDLEVKADDEAAAIEKAIYLEGVKIDVDGPAFINCEVEGYRKLIEGNVMCFWHNQVSVLSVEEDED